MRQSATLLGMAALVAAIVAAPAYVQGQQGTSQAHGEQHQAQGEGVARDAAAPEPHQQMKRMMAEMHAADAKLDALVLAMNAAKGPEKVDAIAALVTALVEQHRGMRGSMAMMMGRMSSMDKTSPSADMPTGTPKH